MPLLDAKAEHCSSVKRMHKLHEELGIRNAENGPKTELYEGIQAMLTGFWKKNMMVLRGASTDGLGLITDSVCAEDDFERGIIPRLPEIDTTKLAKQLDAATSRQDVINGLMGAMLPGTQRVTKQAYSDFANAAPIHVGSIRAAARSLSHNKKPDDLNLVDKLGGGTNTARRIIWPMFDTAARLHEEETGEAPTPEEWEALSKATLPVISLMAQSHINVFSAMREVIQYDGHIANANGDAVVPPITTSAFTYTRTASGPHIDIHPDVFDWVKTKVLEQMRQEYMGDLRKIGCPGSRIIPVMHAWCMDTAKTHLFHRSSRMSGLPEA